MVVAVSLPTYVLHRVRTNRGVTNFEYGMRRLVYDHDNKLSELCRILEQGSDIDEEEVRYLDSDGVARLKDLAKAMEDSAFRKDAVTQYLDAIKKEIQSVSDSLRADYADNPLKSSGI